MKPTRSNAAQAAPHARQPSLWSHLPPSEPPATVLSADQALHWLTQWADAGVLRQLDAAMPQQLWRLQPQVSPAVLVAVALLTHMEGRGHTCLPVSLLLQPAAPEAQALLAWPAAALQGETGLLALWQHMPRSMAAWLQALHEAQALGLLRQTSAPGAAPDLEPAEPAPDLGQPLVLVGGPNGGHLYWRRYAAYEHRVGQRLRQRALARLPVDVPLARQWLNRLFGPLPGADSGVVNAASTGAASDASLDWQRLACAVALRAPLAVITGGPGTGKTYTAARLLTLLLALHRGPQPLRVALAAPTGKAAARLKQSIDKALADLPVPPELLAKLNVPARTLHSLLGARPDTRHWKHHAGHPLDVDLLMVDEASMVHLEMMDAVLDALPAHARLVLLGDKDQLASVEAGAVLGDVCRHAAQGAYSASTAQDLLALSGQVVGPQWQVPPGQQAPVLAQVTAMLRHSHRFDGPIGELALAVQRGDALAARRVVQRGGQALACLQGAGPGAGVQAVCALALQEHTGWAEFAALVRQPPPPQAGVAAHEAWVKAVLQAFERLRVLCAVREGEWGVAGLNAALLQALRRHAGWPAASGEWFAGRPVMVLRNDAHTGVFNGDVGVALPAAPLALTGALTGALSGASGEAEALGLGLGLGGQRAAAGLRVWFQDGQALRSVAVMRLPEVQTAFAMTVHKSQGSEFAHTVLVLPPQGGPLLARELVYTGITRSRERLTLVEAQEGLLEAALARTNARASGLAQAWE